MKIQKEYWFVIASGMISGLIVFMGQVFRNLGLSAYEISTLPYFVTCLILTPFVFLNKKHGFKSNLFGLLLLYIIFSVTTIYSQYIAIFAGAPVALVVLFLYTQPLWTFLISIFFLKEKATKYNVWGSILVLLGILLLVNPFQAANHSTVAGIIVALIGGIGLSGWVVFGSLLSKRGNSPMNSLFSIMAGAVIFGLISQPFASKLIHQPDITNLSIAHSPKIWLIIIAYSTVVTLFSHLLYLNGVKKVKTVDAGIIMLLEPVVGVILAAIFLHQPITLSIILGGALILFANYLVISKSSTNE